MKLSYKIYEVGEELNKTEADYFSKIMEYLEDHEPNAVICNIIGIDISDICEDNIKEVIDQVSSEYNNVVFTTANRFAISFSVSSKKDIIILEDTSLMKKFRGNIIEAINILSNIRFAHMGVNLEISITVGKEDIPCFSGVIYAGSVFLYNNSNLSKDIYEYNKPKPIESSLISKINNIKDLLGVLDGVLDIDNDFDDDIDALQNITNHLNTEGIDCPYIVDKLSNNLFLIILKYESNEVIYDYLYNSETG